MGKKKGQFGLEFMGGSGMWKEQENVGDGIEEPKEGMRERERLWKSSFK